MPAPIQAARMRAMQPARADVGADHRDQRRAEAERERHQQIFEPRAGAVAGDRGGAERADEAGGDRDRHVGADGHDRGDDADAQDLAEQRPAQRRAGEAEPRPHRCGRTTGTRRSTMLPSDVVERRPRRAPPATPSRGNRPPAEDQQRRERNDEQRADGRDQRGHRHVAGAADDVGERVEDPQQHRCRRTPRWNR